MQPRGAESSPQSDLGPALQDRYEHHVGDADAPDQERHTAQSQEELQTLRANRQLGGKRVGRPVDLHLLRVRRIHRDGPDAGL